MRKYIFITLCLSLILYSTIPLAAHAVVVTFLISGTSYSTPSDWNNSNNTIECIGNGGNGNGLTSSGGGGGGGGAYAKISNLTMSGSIAYVVGTGGSLNDTYFNGVASTSASLSCAPGKGASGTTGGAGGLTANSTGTTKFAGGSGETNIHGGGGGAGGTTGNGGNGSATDGGAGGATSGGASPGIPTCTVGDTIGLTGISGSVWDGSHGAGSGGSGGCSCFFDTDFFSWISANYGGDGGSYGGGGGGSGENTNINCTGFGAFTGGLGSQGIITITYTPSVVAVSLRGGLKIRSFGSLKITSGGLKIK